MVYELEKLFVVKKSCSITFVWLMYAEKFIKSKSGVVRLELESDGVPS